MFVECIYNGKMNIQNGIIHKFLEIFVPKIATRPVCFFVVTASSFFFCFVENRFIIRKFSNDVASLRYFLCMRRQQRIVFDNIC